MADIYLDHNATAPARQEVIESMERALTGLQGNPSSSHRLGSEAREAVEFARNQVAALVAARSSEVIFTSGATEANNSVFYNVDCGSDSRPSHIVVGSADHSSILRVACEFERRGFEVTRLPVDAEGRLGSSDVLEALRSGTSLVCLLWANNETGVIHPVQELACAIQEEVARRPGRVRPWLHVDAVQAAGKLPVRFEALPVDSISLSAHKLRGPTGVGALVVKQDAVFRPWLRGGSQEHGRRAGTENVSGIIGFGVACECVTEKCQQRAASLAALRDRLWAGIERSIPRVRRSSGDAPVLANTLCVEFENVAGDVLRDALDLEGVFVSAGSACASGSSEPSHVLSAMGRSSEQAGSAVRFSLGDGNDASQIDGTLSVLAQVVERIRAQANR